MRVARKRKAVVSYKEVSENEIEGDKFDALAASATKKQGKKKKEAGSFLHRSVSKEFPGMGHFSGTVTAYDASEELWQVTYSDGDQEELNEEELMPLLSPLSTSTPSEKKGSAAAAASPMDTEGKAKGKKAKSASSSTSASTSKAAAPPEKKFTDWVVKEMTYPCHDDDARPEVTELGRYKTEAAAIKAARAARDNNCIFEGWAEDFYDADEPPPYWSGDGENYDEDYYVKIYLLSPKQQNEAAAKQAAAKKKAHSSAAPPSWSRHLVASGPFGELATATKPSYDAGYFCRNPCHVPGGLAEIDPSPGKYPSSGQFGMLHRIQQNSERHYAMHAFVNRHRAAFLASHFPPGGKSSAPNVGAAYVTYARKHVLNRCVGWASPWALDHFEEDTRPGGSIVDACHAALLVPRDRYCESLLTAEHLVGSCSKATRSLFVNCFNDAGQYGQFRCPGYAPDAVARAVAATEGGLECLALTETPLCGAVLEELAKCPELRGVMFERASGWAPEPSPKGEGGVSSSSSSAVAPAPPSDELMAALLRACPKLEWVYVDIPMGRGGGGHGGCFGDACFTALAEPGVCPNLQVLWVDATKYDAAGGRLNHSLADPDLVRAALGPGSCRAAGGAAPLKLCMVNRDKTAKTRYVLGGAPRTAATGLGRGKKAEDQLTGDKEPKENYYSSWF